MDESMGLTKLFYSIDESAEILGISRSSAYELANQWLRSDGEQGLPCTRLGRRILVPRTAITRLATVEASFGAPGDSDQS